MKDMAEQSSVAPSSTPPRRASKRKLFTPAPPSSSSAADEALARSIQEQDAGPSRLTRSYSLRTRRSTVKTKEENRQQLVSAVKAEPEVDDKDAIVDVKLNGRGSQKVKSSAPAADPFSISPQKKDRKKIKLELDPSQVKPAPKRWKEQLAALQAQRRRIVAPVDEMGCEENGTDAHRADGWRIEDAESKARRERFTCLVSLMLSSQTKDEVTAASVKNLQTNLPDGLSLQSILAATDDEISSNINKVGFWRRKTGYIKSAAQIISSQFDGDVPRDIDELCSLPGVGPKMAFLCLQSAWGINLGIGVDVHVHRMSNRLGWCKTSDPEDTRLVLQSWLPKDLHHSINKTLVGFGQVVCVPVGPRCDLCELGKQRLCPSRRAVDQKSIVNRKAIHFLGDEEDAEGSSEPKLTIALQGPDGVGEVRDAPIEGAAAGVVKKEEADVEDALMW